MRGLGSTKELLGGMVLFISATAWISSALVLKQIITILALPLSQYSKTQRSCPFLNIEIYNEIFVSIYMLNLMKVQKYYYTVDIHI